MKTMTKTASLVLFAAASMACIAEKIEHVDPRLTPAEQSFSQDLATAYCDALFQCEALDDCDAIAEYEDAASCIEGESTKLEELQSAAVDAGLTYDADCVQQTIATYATSGCADLRRLGLSEYEENWLCPPYHGSGVENQPCEESWPTRLSECGARMICMDDQCNPIDDDTACACDEGFGCAPNSGGQCLPIVADGEVCFTDEAVGACAGSSHCTTPDPLPPEGELVEWRCQPRVALGEACTHDDACLSGACEENVCALATPGLCEPGLAPSKWL
jgi:hypothetical protein